MIREWVEKLKVEYVETRSMILADLNLFQEWLTENVDWDGVNVGIHLNKMFKHQFSHVDLPIELDQKES